MSRTSAALVLTTSFLLFLALHTLPTPAAPEPLPKRGGDVVTYQAVLSRLRTGEPYYAVVGDELRRGQYATQEAFNWRTPFLWTTLARVPDVAGRAALVALGLLMLGATFAVTSYEPLCGMSGGIMQAGAIGTLTLPGAALFGESWSGVLIGLSVCMYAQRRARLAVVLGLLALGVRELAAPYCVACAVKAAVNRRWREVGAWLGGACLYAVYYGWHLVNVWEHRLPTDLAHATSWLELGGLPSLVTKVRWQAWLLASPTWANALALTLIVAGAAQTKMPAHARVATAVYLGFFMVAGKPFDGYWGLVAWPTWALAFGYGLLLVRDAARSVITSPPGR